ncbi:unnamed protein product [Diatraea saccharalis]|uniref:AMP-dependent synthetase/ligase domain-containing protein n=1 Tax=Diatraea saccharalis TaxID=40085 RepID=A0A9N9R8S0_9NEOP|nr:unnamed protein product [Diatraea saccharalis]
MKVPRYTNDAVHWFINELTSRIVAESGIPSDRYHLGKILIQSLKDAPDFLTQIDGATDERENNSSVLERTVRCANAMKAASLKVGDVVILMAPNHIDLVIPFYAALYLGVIVAAVDRTLGIQELRNSFNINRPRMVFCQNEKVSDIQNALDGLELDTLIVTFDKGDLCSFNKFLERGINGPSVNEFRPTDFNPEDTIGLLIATSGTTGLPKSAAVTHKSLVISGPYLWQVFSTST